MKNIYEVADLRQFDHLSFIAKQIVEGFITGMHKSPFHGFSVEFAEHRIYNQGESTRHVDWKLFARSDKLFVKKYEEETNLRAHIILDTSSSMYFPTEEKRINKLSFSVYMAAALIYLLKKQRDAVGLTFISDKIDLMTPVRTSSLHINYLYEQLVPLLDIPKNILGKTTSLAEQLHHLSEMIHRRSLIIIFSDLLQTENPEELISAIRHLKFKKNEIILIHTLDRKWENNLDFENRPYRFVDMETGKEMKLNPAQIKAAYQQKSTAFFQTIKNKTGNYGIDVLEADIRQPFHQVLTPFVLKRSKLL